MTIDINSDMGEIPAAVEDGTQEELLRYVTQANVACGGHAGDEWTMRRTVEQARRRSVKIGAHPGYPDRANFGRLELAMPPDAIQQTVYEQIAALAAIAGSIEHVKPHGALYNQAVHNRELARAIARGTARFSRDVVIMGLAGSPMLEVFAEEGLRVAGEGFADRRYEADGTLRSRKFPDALIQDPAAAASQALELASRPGFDTICIHSDTPGAVEIAKAVAAIFGR